MVPKKKPGAMNYPSNLRAPPPMTANVAKNAGTSEDVDTAGDVVDASGIGTPTPVVEAEAGGTEEGQH